MGLMEICMQGRKVNAAGFGFYTNFAEADLWHLRCSGWKDAMHSQYQNSDKLEKMQTSKRVTRVLRQRFLPAHSHISLPPFCNSSLPSVSPSLPPSFTSFCLCPRFIVSICPSLSNTDPGAHACRFKIKG